MINKLFSRPLMIQIQNVIINCIKDTGMYEIILFWILNVPLSFSVGWKEPLIYYSISSTLFKEIYMNYIYKYMIRINILCMIVRLGKNKHERTSLKIVVRYFA